MTEISVVVPIFKEFEVICINDGSKDKSIDILKKYHEKDNRIKIVEQENKGLSATRNVGIRMATGNYVTFVDSDDWLEKDTFEKVKKQIDEKYEIIRIEYRINNDEKKDVQYDRDMIFDSKQIRSEVIPKLLKGKILAYSVLLYIKLETLKKNNWFFNEETYYMEDMEYFLNISYECVNMYLKKDILYHYFYNKDGMTKSKKNYEKNIINILKMHDKNISNLIILNKKPLQ